MNRKMNLQTGKDMEIMGRGAIKFKAGETLKEAIH
ncbi:hypothetical protein DWX43_17140 [Clostridium sp. AF19-22AC]|jgi:nucleoid DNA-binding protein|nr:MULTISPECIES: HU family DNA-binding protein [Clostridia]RHR25849.1 hypothetical protein DWX43_17140 [Clostridium sp. AF19-22AC]